MSIASTIRLALRFFWLVARSGGDKYEICRRLDRERVAIFKRSLGYR